MIRKVGRFRWHQNKREKWTSVIFILLMDLDFYLNYLVVNVVLWLNYCGTLVGATWPGLEQLDLGSDFSSRDSARKPETWQRKVRILRSLGSGGFVISNQPLPDVAEPGQLPHSPVNLPNLSEFHGMDQNLEMLWMNGLKIFCSLCNCT